MRRATLLPRPSLALALAVALPGAPACDGGKTTPIADDSGGADGGDGGDGGPTGTDNDGDGVTVEDGDCDDDDYEVNPFWPEDPYDGKDNDCDGRVDELWAGLALAEQRASGRSGVRLLDTVGRDEGTLTTSVTPWTLTEAVGGEGWLVTGYPYFQNLSAGFSLVSSGLVPSFDDSVPWYQPSELVVVSDGAEEVLATVGDPDYDACFALPEDQVGDCFGALFEEAPRTYFFGPYVRGVATHPEGWYAVLTAGALWRLDPDGQLTELGSWGWNLDTRDVVPFELYGNGVAVDPATGTVGVLGLFGGFATWTADAGLVMQKATSLPVELTEADLEALDVSVGLVWLDGDGWYTLSADFTTGAYALRRFNLNEGDWVDKVDWINDLILPLGLTTDGDQGDFYATAKGGDIRTAFRVRGADSSIDDFFTATDDGVTFWGAAHRY